MLFNELSKAPGVVAVIADSAVLGRSGDVDLSRSRGRFALDVLDSLLEHRQRLVVCCPNLLYDASDVIWDWLLENDAFIAVAIGDDDYELGFTRAAVADLFGARTAGVSHVRMKLG